MPHLRTTSPRLEANDCGYRTAEISRYTRDDHEAATASPLVGSPPPELAASRSVADGHEGLSTMEAMPSMQGEKGSTGARGRTQALLMFALLLALFAAQFVLLYGRGEEDAYISYRYASNLARHGELVYNLGERVEGISNLSWTAALAALYCADIPIRFAGWLLGVSSALFAFRFTFVASRAAMGSSPLWPLPLFALATHSTTLAAFGNGLEGPLWSALLVALVAGAFLDRPWFVAASACCLPWTRPEGLAISLLALAWLGAELRAKKLAAREAGLLALSIAASVVLLFAFRLAYFHDWIPNTLRAKSMRAVSTEGFLAGARYIWTYVRSGGVATALAASLAFVLAPSRLRRASWLASGVVASGLVVVLGNSGDWMPDSRLLSPYTPVIALLAFMSVERVRQLSDRTGVAIALFLVATSTTGLRPALLREGASSLSIRWELLFRDPVSFAYPLIANMPGLTVRDVVQPRDVVVLEAGGLPGYLLLESTVLELQGLTDRELASRANGAFEAPRFGRINWRAILERRPSFIKLHSSIWRIAGDDPIAAAALEDYLVIQSNDRVPPEHLHDNFYSPIEDPRAHSLLVRVDHPRLADLARSKSTCRFSAFSAQGGRCDP